jgi:adenosylhomocysteine nucleosidase
VFKQLVPILEVELEEQRVNKRFVTALLVAALSSLAAAQAGIVHPASRGACLTECTPRIGIVSAFGQEAAILVAQTRSPHTWVINGNRFTTGVLRGEPVVVVLSGVGMVNAAMVTQSMVDHFEVRRLVMSGIAGGVNPAHHVGDVMIPDRWAMPLEVFWNGDDTTPAPCGKPADVSCLGLKLAEADGKPVPPFTLATAAGPLATGLFMRQNFVMTAANAPAGEFRFDYPVDPAMLAVARGIRPTLARCGPKATRSAGAQPDPALCVKTTPQLVVGGRGVSGSAFLANAPYRRYLFEQLQAQAFEMETAALAHVAYANGVPYLAIRSLSDLAGAQELDADVVALFSSGLAEANEAAVTLAFLDGWHHRPGSNGHVPAP